eukprot:GAHX01002367.1.p1 GENE.GAHX01002367.1~~GAHX01002367.1.p1  ORF type:complete len:491 (-),score=66.65 GAHX01002367.1:18-1490(-)
MIMKFLFLYLANIIFYTSCFTVQNTKKRIDLQTFAPKHKKNFKINPGSLIDNDLLIASLISSQVNFQNFIHTDSQSYHFARHVFRQFDQGTTISESSSNNTQIDSLTFSSDGVFSTIIIPGDTNKKYLAILDTGSNDIVLPLPAFPVAMTTFKPLPPITTLSQTYRATFKCPSFVRTEFLCSKEGYVGVGYNSILGKDIIRFPDGSMSFDQGTYHTVFYFLNTLYGFNPNLAIIGIGFDDSGMRLSSSLFEGFLDVSNFEITQKNEDIHITDADTVFPSLEESSYKKGSFKTNVTFDRRQYHSTKLKKYINHISGSSFKGIKIIKPVTNCTDQGCSSAENSVINTNGFVDEQVILDSGTNGLILSSDIFVEFVRSVKEIADPELGIFKNGDKIYFICWAADNQYSFLMDFGSFKLKIPLSVVELMETDEGKTAGSKSKQCSYINLMQGTKTNILGYPYWKLFDVIFEGDNMELHIKKGETCTGECDLISI